MAVMERMGVATVKETLELPRADGLCGCLPVAEVDPTKRVC